MEDSATTLREIRDLMTRMVELLEPIADNYRDAFEVRKVERRRALEATIRRLLSSPSRRRAWELADGSRNQASISRESRLDGGETSRLFRELKEMEALDTRSSNPKRQIELTE